MAMPYTKNAQYPWTDTVDVVDGAALDHIEDGIATAQATAEAAITDIDYTNAMPGSRTTMLYTSASGGGFVNPATGAIAASRPSARTDIYFDLVGGTSAVADPAWMINGDAREVTV